MIIVIIGFAGSRVSAGMMMTIHTFEDGNCRVFFAVFLWLCLLCFGRKLPISPGENSRSLTGKTLIQSEAGETWSLRII